MKRGRKVWHILIFIVVFAAIVALVMGLWNVLIPGIIGWSAINYWQAAGLMILCRLLFSGFGGFRHRHRHLGGHPFKNHAHFHEKMKHLSPEERREYLRKRMESMHTYGPHSHEEEKETHEQ